MMKVLIWIGCCILHYIFSSIIKPIVYQMPVTDDRSILLVSTLYGILIAASFGCCFTLAKKLCKKWDLYKASKNAVKAETTTREYNSYQALLNENSEGPSLEETPNKPEPIETDAPNIKPNKKIKSKKPLIIVTYVLLISIILSLSVFCILYVTEKENAVSQLESDNSDLQNEIKKLKTEKAIAEYEMTNFESKVDRLNKTIEAKDNNIYSLKKQINDYKAEAELWKNKFMNSDPANVTYSYEFSSVNALLTAIKKNPTAYHNQQIKVYGMLFTYEHETFNRKEIALIDYKGEELPDTDGFKARFFKNDKIEAKQAIEVTLSSDLQYTVAETGDYVNLYGIVRITNGEIYLDKCQYN